MAGAVAEGGDLAVTSMCLGTGWVGLWLPSVSVLAVGWALAALTAGLWSWAAAKALCSRLGVFLIALASTACCCCLKLISSLKQQFGLG